MRRAIAVAFAAWVLTSAAAEKPAAIQFGTEPLTHSRDGRVEGCGVRLTGGDAPAAGPSRWLDVSLNVFRRGVGVVQAITYEMPRSRYDSESRPERVGIQRVWLKPDEEAGSTRLGENTEARDTLVYTVTLDEAAGLFRSVAGGRRLQVGLRAWGRPRETVYAGSVEMDENTRAQLETCMAALVN